MIRPRLLDLYSCAGGAAMGYHQAGFEVVGVDINPQPNYPFEHHVRNALDVLADPAFLASFDAVHASPPCQAHTQAQRLHGRKHLDLLPATRSALRAWGGPWVIENVPGAPMDSPVQLCGSEFGLGVTCRDGVYREIRRHRLFESNTLLMGAGGCRHSAPAISVFGDGGPRVTPRPGAVYEGPVSERRLAMGVDWTTRRELSESIPPAYTRFIGEQLLTHLAVGVAS